MRLDGAFYQLFVDTPSAPLGPKNAIHDTLRSPTVTSGDSKVG